tara:strand:- start:96 stop:356 length:261 start_codon:yes stop_codon:yes gene_type:complete
MASVKKKTNGFKSSEFWLSLISVILGAILTQLEADGASGPWIQIAGAVIAGLGAKSYNDSRAKTKAALVAAESVAEAARGTDAGKS